jgi:hypothetical protein
MFFKKNQSKINSKEFSDYSELLEIFSEEGIDSFYDLKPEDKEEIVAAYIQDEEACDKSDLLYAIIESDLLSEMLYGSISKEDVGQAFYKFLMNGPHINVINEDMSLAFSEKLINDENYKNTDLEELLIDDRKDRFNSIKGI